MTVKVAFFALAKEIAGCDCLQLELDDSATIRQVKDMLVHRFPDLQGLLECSTWALNQEYVDHDTALSHGAEIGMIPPVSGG